MTFPTNPTAGQRHQEPSGIWYTWKDCGAGVGAWDQDRAQLTYYDPIPLGAIQAFTIGAAPNGWLLCDGSTYDQTVYPELFAVLGVATVPDLRGEFLRGRKVGETLGAHIDWTTGTSRLSLSSNGAHDHGMGNGRNYVSTSGGNHNLDPGGGGAAEGWVRFTREGDHTHTINGGDTETAPDHTLCDFYIKAAHAKVNLPNAGFLTNATTLHDGDVWQFDSVSNTFKNVPASTLVSGMTVGAVPPTAPFNGQQWMLNAGPERGLKIYDATDADPANHGWLDADRNPVLYVGSGAFNTGTVNEAGNWGMPANTVPSPKSVMPQPDDQYLDVGTGIFKRLTGPAAPGGGAAPASPIDSGISGASTIGDVLPSIPTYDYMAGDQYVTTDHIFTLAKPATKWVQLEGMIQCSSNFTAAPWITFSDGDWDPKNTTTNIHQQSMCTYEDGGVRDIGTTYFTMHAAGFVYRNTDNYDVKGNTPLFFKLFLQRLGSYWMAKIESTFKSSNDSPMRFSSTWQIGKSATLTKVGIIPYDKTGATKQAGPYSFNVSYM